MTFDKLSGKPESAQPGLQRVRELVSWKRAGLEAHPTSSHVAGASEVGRAVAPKPSALHVAREWMLQRNYSLKATRVPNEFWQRSVTEEKAALPTKKIVTMDEV